MKNQPNRVEEISARLRWNSKGYIIRNTATVLVILQHTKSVDAQGDSHPPPSSLEVGRGGDGHSSTKKSFKFLLEIFLFPPEVGGRAENFPSGHATTLSDTPKRSTKFSGARRFSYLPVLLSTANSTTNLSGETEHTSPSSSS